MARSGVELKINGKKYENAERRLSDISRWLNRGQKRAFGRVVTKEFAAQAGRNLRTLSVRHSKPWPAGTTDGKPATLSQRSGALVGALSRSYPVRRRGDTWELKVVLPHYAKIQEFGGVIKPKRSKYLTVPLPPALDSRGVARRRRARDWPNTFVYKSKRGNLLIAQRRNGALVNLYVLKKSVRIRPRLGLRKEFNDRANAMLSAIATKFAEELRKNA